MNFSDNYFPPDPDRGPERVPDVSQYDEKILRIINDVSKIQDDRVNHLAIEISADSNKRIDPKSAKKGVIARMRQLNGRR